MNMPWFPEDLPELPPPPGPKAASAIGSPLKGPFVYDAEIAVPATNLPALRSIRTDNSTDLAVALIETLSSNQLFAASGREIRVSVIVGITVNPEAEAPWSPDHENGGM